ncbi:MAG TPA: hypothetical protein VLU43_02350 [Anaeromyxobacteraceae bacterium]|nr:hypothetical protein [Anaeromyxobacteraceae bacterium]
MPKDLAALLVEEGVVAAKDMEHALERQFQAGGALDSALLELGLADEARLLPFLARATALPVAPPSAWTQVDARARRVFPSKVSERHGLAPFALDGRELSLVATCPVDTGLLDEISFMLSLHLVPHVGPEWRVRELIHRLYGTPFPQRLSSLAAGTAGARVPGGGPAATAPPEEAGAAADQRPAGAVQEGAAPRAGFALDAAEPEPLAAALAAALDDIDITVEEPEEGGTAAPEEGGAWTTEAAAAWPGEPPREAAAGPAPEPAPPPDAAPAPEPAAEEPEPPAELDRSAPPRWRLKDARAVLEAAVHRDQIVLAALRYTRDFFDHAALFAVTHDAIVGHDALGDEAARDHARGTAIYANDPGMFRTVLETKSPYLGPVDAQPPGNAAVLAGLARGVPRTVLVFPVLVRDRAVCILYADNGEAPVSPRRLGDLLLFLATVGNAFQRLLRARKERAGPRRTRVPAPAVPAAPQVERAPPPEHAPEPGASVPPIPAEERPPAATHAAPGSLASAGAPPPAAGASPQPSPAPVAPPPDAESGPGEDHARDRQAAAAPDTTPVDAATEVQALLASQPGSPSRARIAARLARRPAESASALCAALPGPLEIAEEAMDDVPVDAWGPVPGALAALGRPAARPLVAVLTDPEALRRRIAIALLTRLGDPTSFAALADRAFDPEPRVAAAAVEALAHQRRAPEMRGVAEKLRRALLSGISDRPVRAARALGALRDVDAIPLLIQVLEASDPAAAEAAGEALEAVTLQRLGSDARRWLAWWKENRGRGRAEWIFAGLTSQDRVVRTAAAAELRAAAPSPVEYSEDLPPDARERAARAWAGWWARSGKVL